MMKSSKQKPLKSIVLNTLELRTMGEEPTWENQDNWTRDEYEIQLAKAFNWYNVMLDDKMRYAAIIQYLTEKKTTKTDLEALEQVESWRILNSIGSLCRCVLRGLKLDKEAQARLDLKFDDLFVRGKVILKDKKKKAKVAPAPLSIQDHIRNAASECIAEIEEIIDGFIRDNTTTFRAYDWLAEKNVKPMVAGKIGAFYTPQFEELELAYSKKDTVLNEAYQAFPKKKLKIIMEFYRAIVNDCYEWSTNVRKSKIKKPRKPREKSIEKVVSKIKYQKDDTSLKIVSVDPAKIIGASELWLFNTKYRTMAHYVAIDRGGLQIKGTTLKQYDEKVSTMKKIRKPEDFVSKIISGSVKGIIKTFDSLKVKPSACNGRINEATIILRVIK
jgi:hypothetical protein